MKPPTILTACTLLLCLQYSHQLEFIPPGAQERYGDALEAIFGMGIRLQALMDDPKVTTNANFIISPLSAAEVIGQMMLGTNEGEFQDQLYGLLSLPNQIVNKKYILKTHMKNGQNVTRLVPYSNLHLQFANLMKELEKDNALKKTFTLQSSNAIFVSNRLTLRPDFVYETKFLYDSKVRKVNFKNGANAMRIINGWGANHTNGLIKTILQMPPLPTTSSIFANAIYFLGEWEQPFSSEINTNGPFHVNQDTAVETVFMSGFLEQIPYAEHKGLNCKMVVLPYLNRELGMYVVLPNKGHKHEYDISAFGRAARTTDFLEMIQSLKNKDVNVKIPKVQLVTSLNILEPLQRYASFKQSMKNNAPAQSGSLFDILEDTIDAFKQYNATTYPDVVLDNAAVNANLRVSNVYQQISFAINEKGTEAAAITAGIMDYSGGSKTLLANKPFMFFIRHEATGATLFWGAISNPLG